MDIATFHSHRLLPINNNQNNLKKYFKEYDEFLIPLWFMKWWKTITSSSSLNKYICPFSLSWRRKKTYSRCAFSLKRESLCKFTLKPFIEEVVTFFSNFSLIASWFWSPLTLYILPVRIINKIQLCCGIAWVTIVQPFREKSCMAHPGCNRIVILRRNICRVKFHFVVRLSLLKPV